MYTIVRKVLDKGRVDGVLVKDENTGLVTYVNKGCLGSYQYSNAKISRSERISGEGFVEVEKNKLIPLYHGSRYGLQSINLGFRRNVDFGNGFYLNKNKQKANEWVCEIKGSVVYSFILDISGLSLYRFRDDIAWALFIAINREKISAEELSRGMIEKLKCVKNKDLLIGSIADDKMFEAFEGFMDGSLTLEGLCYCLKYIDCGEQWVLKTSKSLDNLFLVSVNRSSGVRPKYNMSKLLYETRIKTRKGLYIDEIRGGKI